MKNSFSIYRLAEPRNGRLVLSLAALLLFAKDPQRWQPACYVDFVKWQGTERRFGTELNVIMRWKERPLRFVHKIWDAIDYAEDTGQD